MKSRSIVALALTTALAAGGLALAASAQQPPAPPAPGAGGPPPHGDDFGPGPGRRGGWGMFGMGPGMGGPRAHLSEADRAALLDGRIAEVKTGLTLTPDQQKLWDPLEAAVRDGIKKGEALRKDLAEKGRAKDPIDRLERMAEMSKTRGEIMEKIADAAKPFYESLSADQKHRLAILMHRPGGEHGWGERMRDRMHGRMHGGMRPFHDFGDDHAAPERQGALQPAAPGLYQPALDLLARDPFAAAGANGGRRGL